MCKHKTGLHDECYMKGFTVSKVSTKTRVLTASMLALGVLATGVAPAVAVGGQESTVQGQTTPGIAVWGMEQNDYMGSFKIPTSNGLDDGVFFDTLAEKPRTEFNTLVTFNQSEQLATDTKVSGSNVSKEGLRQIIGATSLGKDISISQGLNDSVKELLASYGYDGDYGQKWGFAAQGLNQALAQSPTTVADGEKIPVTQGDYVMMAISASIYNGANPQAFPVPVSTQAITGMFDEGQSAGMTDDFNKLVSAINAMGTKIPDEVVDAANVMVLTYDGNDNGNGDVSYKRAVSFRQSVVLNVSDIEKGGSAPTSTTTTIDEATDPAPEPSGYDPTGQNTATAEPTTEPEPEPEDTPEPTSEPTTSTTSTPAPRMSAPSALATSNSNEGQVVSTETVTPTSQKLSMGSTAGSITSTNNTTAMVGATTVALLMLGAVGFMVRRKLQ